MDKKFFIFIGRSGSGKGTQAELLQEYLKLKGVGSVKHFTTGGGFREFINKENNYSSLLSRDIVNRGGLMPNFLAVWNWTNILIENMESDDSVILDGAPRKLVELEALSRAVKFYQFKKPVVIYFDVSERWAIKRLEERGREDDKDVDNIKKKMEWFEEDVLPCVDFYMKNDWSCDFVHINGEEDIEKVHESLTQKIELL
ncbi:MAG: adenylate kinase [Patescibacteria group bacterium]|nr:adenylate kinase [Patescibacteria group bacterium]